MPQYLNPSSDLTTDAVLTTSPYWSKLDDGVGGSDPGSGADSDYLTLSPTDGTGYGVVALQTATNPNTDASHYFRFRVEYFTGSTISVALYCGSTLIKSEIKTGGFPVPAGFNFYEVSLSEAEASAITDYSDLRIRIGGSAASSNISMVEVEIPDVILDDGGFFDAF